MRWLNKNFIKRTFSSSLKAFFLRSIWKSFGGTRDELRERRPKALALARLSFILIAGIRRSLIGHKKAVGSTEAVKDKMEDVSLENYGRADDTLFEVWSPNPRNIIHSWSAQRYSCAPFGFPFSLFLFYAPRRLHFLFEKRLDWWKEKGELEKVQRGGEKGYIVMLLLRLLIRLLNRFYDVFSAAENLRSAVNFSLSISRPHFPFSCSPHPVKISGITQPSVLSFRVFG